MSTAESTLEVQDPSDSLEEPEQEPGEPEAVEPAESAADAEEVAAAEDEAPSAEQQDGAGESDGQPRDAQGRFAPKAEPGTAVAAPPESSPPPADTSPSGEPFSFKVDGYKVDVEGAYRADGKIVMPEEAWDRVVQTRVADRGRIQQREERMSTRIRTLEAAAEAREADFKTILERVESLIRDPEALQEFARNHEANAPRLILEIENRLLKARSERSQQTQQHGQKEAEEREFNERAPHTIQAAVEHLIDSEHKGLTVDRAALAKEIQADWEAGVELFFRVEEGDGSGLDPSEHKIGIDLKRVRRLLTPRIALYQKSEAANRAAQVEAANKAALGKAKKPAAPPVAPAAGSPTPGGESKVPTTREEYEEYKKRRSAELNLPM